jgi:LmbE family N-acetylglucosaminyl deacetylase
MLTLFESPSTATHPAEASPDVSDDGPSWRLAQAVHLLRLTVADASLRAREEAQHFEHASVDHWQALGRAHGYYEATLVLRAWTHPIQPEDVVERLEQRSSSAQVNYERVAPTAQNATVRRAFHGARVWALRWVTTQVGELAAHAYSLS